MVACSIENLRLLLDKQLNLDGRLEILDHLDGCDACREMVYLLSRKRDRSFFIYKPYIDEGQVA
ncbi:MAG TPA: hypothetical protein VE398_18755 [Acidobacteriota bacterium]|nr:hypothetical protein [Acidobacteriota bacterium]